MHYQKQTAQAIIQRKADYVLTVKGNQKELADAIGERCFAFGDLDQKVEGLRQHVIN